MFSEDEKHFSLSREAVWDFTEKLIHSWLSLKYRSLQKIVQLQALTMMSKFWHRD
jgi:hypothetical protein